MTEPTTGQPTVTRGTAIGASVGTAGALVVGADPVIMAYQVWTTGVWPETLGPGTIALATTLGSGALSVAVYLVYWLLAKLGAPVPVEWGAMLGKLKMFKQKKEPTE